MNITQRNRDLGTRLRHEAVGHPDGANRGRSRHAMTGDASPQVSGPVYCSSRAQASLP